MPYDYCFRVTFKDRYKSLVYRYFESYSFFSLIQWLVSSNNDIPNNWDIVEIKRIDRIPHGCEYKSV